MKKLIVFTLTTILCLGLFACSEGPSFASPSSGVVDTEDSPMPADAEHLKLVGDSNSFGDDGFVYFAIGLENPNDDYAVSGHIVSYEGFVGGREGEMVCSEEIPVPKLLPGETRYIAKRLGNGTAPNYWEVGSVADNEVWEKTDQQYVQVLETINNKIEYPEHLTMVLTGEVVLCEGADPAKASDTVEIVVIFKDKDGNIAFGISDTMSNFTVEETATYEITLENYLQYHFLNATPEVYAYPV